MPRRLREIQAFSQPAFAQAHAFAALAAFGLGAWQLLARRGGLRHRVVGRSWVALMVLVAISSFGIHDLRVIGRFSPLHGLSIATLVALAVGVHAARNGMVRRHRRAMTLVYVSGLLLAGFLTFVPGRIMHAVLFGA